MLKSIGVGSELFHKLIESDCYYVADIPQLKPTNSKILIVSQGSHLQ